MTPKEKAKELITEFQSVLFSDEFHDAKKCALIAVEEVMDTFPTPYWDGDKEHSPELLGDILFWNEVKQEIEKL